MFTSKLEENGQSASSFSTQELTSSPPMISYPVLDQTIKTPPRLVSDQLINIFFQEWAPLYPVVHRPTILKTYDHYLTDADSLSSNKYAAAQLNLIFGIAALSARVRYHTASIGSVEHADRGNSRGPTRIQRSLNRTGTPLWSLCPEMCPSALFSASSWPRCTAPLRRTTKVSRGIVVLRSD